MINEIKIKLTIDGKEANSTLTLTDDNIQQINDSFRRTSQTSQTTAEGINRGFERARNTLQGVQEVIRAFTATYGNVLQTFSVQEQAERRLAATMQTLNIYTEENFNLLKEQASAIQAVTVVGDEQSLKMQALALNMGISYKQVNTVLKGSIGLAELYASAQLSQETALKGVALALQGNFTQLNRYIPELRSAGSEAEKTAILMQKMEQGFEVAKETADTASGALNQLSNSFGDLQEQTGGAIAVAITPLVKSFTEMLTAINTNIPAVSGLIGALSLAAGTALTLKVTGLLPLILNTDVLSKKYTILSANMKANAYSSQMLSARFKRLALSGKIAAGGVGTLRLGLIQARIAAKAFFASLGPIGWALLGISALTTVWELFSDGAEETADKTHDAATELELYKQKISSMDTDEFQDEYIRRMDARNEAIKNGNKETLELEKTFKAAWLAEHKKRKEGIEKQQTEEEKKAALAAEKMRIEALQSGRNKELLKLKVWYDSQNETYKGQQAALAALTQLYSSKRRAIHKKHDDLELKTRASTMRKQWELEQLHLEYLGKSDVEILEAHKQKLHEIAGIYADGSKEKNNILHEIAKLQYSIEEATNTEQTLKKELSLEIDDAKFEQDLVDMEGRLQTENQPNLIQTIFGFETETPDFSLIDAQIKRQEELIDKNKANTKLSADERKLQEIQLNTELSQLQNQRAQTEIEIERRKSQTLKEMSQQAWGQLTQLVDQYYTQRRQQEAAAVEREFENRQEALNSDRERAMKYAFTEGQKAAINKRYDEQEKKLEAQKVARIRKAQAEGFEVQKAINLAQAVMNTATAVTRALMELGPIAGPVMASVVGTLGAAQVAMINSQQPPAFNQGGIVSGPGGPEDDEILARLSDGEYVVKASMTHKYKPYIQMINNDKFDNWLHQNKTLRGYAQGGQAGKADLPTVAFGAGIEKKLTGINDTIEKVGLLVAETAQRPITADIEEYATKAIFEKGQYNSNRLEL